MTRTARTISQLYAFLLKLYPRRFTEQYGEEMAAVFSESCQAEERSTLAVFLLGLRELRDLPINLIREYGAALERKHMQNQSNPAQSFFGIILRAMIAYGISFSLIYLLYCLIDTAVNSGKTLWQMNSIWNVLYIHPSALGVAFGALIAGNWKNKRQGWGSAAAAFLGFTLLFRLSRPTFMSTQTQPGAAILQFVFLIILGMFVAGVIGFVQHGIKSVGRHAAAGAIGFVAGWLINDAVSIFIVKQASIVNLNQLVVGSPVYFLYFLVPGLFYGAVIGLCLGTAAVVEKRNKSQYLPI